MPSMDKKPNWMPDSIMAVTTVVGTRKKQKLDFWFDSMAPITGDGIYRRTEDGGMVRYALLINPDAAEHQRRQLRLTNV